MKRRQTLRSRIIFFFCTYLGTLLFVYSVVIRVIIHLAQDVAFERQLLETSNQVIKSLEKNGKIPPTPPLHFQVYSKRSDIPPKLRSFVSNRDSGYFDINTKDLDYYVGIFKVPSTGSSIFLFYDVKSYEFSDDFEFTFSLALLAVASFIFLVGWILSIIISSQIMTPITTLAKTVRSFSPDDPFKPLSNYNAEDEVGLLVSTINELMKRIDQFVQREREFTLFASHELRTPLSVIKGATEIIQTELGDDNKNLLGPLERIDLSIKELDVLISTFLMLARQDQLYNPKDQPCEMKLVAEEVIETYRYLLEGKSVEVILDTKEAGSVLAPARVVNIAIGNLVRNAFQYTMTGRVEIICKVESIQVRDTGLGFKNSKYSSGTGLGLLIVRRLCERMDWDNKISKLPHGGTQTDLFFHKLP